MDYGLIAFSSTFSAMLGEKLLRPVTPVQVMPVLREISAGCGIAIRFPPEDLAAVEAALGASALRREEYTLYAVTGGGSALRVEAL